jgi:hypothetical protein
MVKTLKGNNLLYADQLINNNPENLRILTWPQVTKGKYKGIEPYWYGKFEEKLLEAEFNFAQQYDYINTFNPLKPINEETKFTITKVEQTKDTCHNYFQKLQLVAIQYLVAIICRNAVIVP